MRILSVGATGSVGRHVVDQALARGHEVTALSRRTIRDLPNGARLVVADLTDVQTLEKAVKDVDAVVFTHGVQYGAHGAAAVDYGAVRNVLQILAGRPTRIALMTTMSVTNTARPPLIWKRRSERLLRAGGHPYTIVRPGWFDANAPDQTHIVMRQGDDRQSGTPADGVISRRQIARVLVESLTNDAAIGKTLELSAEHGPEQADLTDVFAALTQDTPGSLDGSLDAENLSLAEEPAAIRQDLTDLGRKDTAG